jgi:hypothetical protein
LRPRGTIGAVPGGVSEAWLFVIGDAEGLNEVTGQKSLAPLDTQIVELSRHQQRPGALCARRGADDLDGLLLSGSAGTVLDLRAL